VKLLPARHPPSPRLGGRAASLRPPATLGPPAPTGAPPRSPVRGLFIHLSPSFTPGSLPSSKEGVTHEKTSPKPFIRRPVYDRPRRRISVGAFSSAHSPTRASRWNGPPRGRLTRHSPSTSPFYPGARPDTMAKQRCHPARADVFQQIPARARHQARRADMWRGRATPASPSSSRLDKRPRLGALATEREAAHPQPRPRWQTAPPTCPRRRR